MQWITSVVARPRTVRLLTNDVSHYMQLFTPLLRAAAACGGSRTIHDGHLNLIAASSAGVGDGAAAVAGPRGADAVFVDKAAPEAAHAIIMSATALLNRTGSGGNGPSVLAGAPAAAIPSASVASLINSTLFSQACRFLHNALLFRGRAVEQMAPLVTAAVQSLMVLAFQSLPTGEPLVSAEAVLKLNRTLEEMIKVCMPFVPRVCLTRG